MLRSNSLKMSKVAKYRLAHPKTSGSKRKTHLAQWLGRKAKKARSKRSSQMRSCTKTTASLLLITSQSKSLEDLEFRHPSKLKTCLRQRKKSSK